MGKMHLDLDTADRILAGLVDPGDAPPGFAAVVALVGAARGATSPAPAVVSAPRRRSGRGVVLRRPRLALLAAAAALAATTGVAYAAGLPADAAATARSVLRKLDAAPGRSVRAHAPSADTHGAAVAGLATTTSATGSQKGAQISALARANRGHTAAAAPPTAAGSGHGKGARISALAHATTGTGGAKGATVSAAASGGKSHAGQHGHNGHGSSGRSHGRGRVRPRGGGALRP